MKMNNIIYLDSNNYIQFSVIQTLHYDSKV